MKFDIETRGRRPDTRSLVMATLALRVAVGAALISALGGAATLHAQQPIAGEVRQLVTFHFLPGRAAEATAVFRERALPLYQRNDAMLTFRGFREVESPVPLDLVVVSSFRGMAGMDESNERLRTMAESEGSSIGAIYGAIAAASASHHDQFVEMLPAAGSGDPSVKRLVAFVWYRLRPGQRDAFERALEERIVPWERRAGIPATTGRFLVSDGWDYLRVLGFDSLGDYQDYWTGIAVAGGYDTVEAITAERRETILSPVADLTVR